MPAVGSVLTSCTLIAHRNNARITFKKCCACPGVCARRSRPARIAFGVIAERAKCWRPTHSPADITHPTWRGSTQNVSGTQLCPGSTLSAIPTCQPLARPSVVLAPSTAQPDIQHRIPACRIAPGAVYASLLGARTRWIYRGAWFRGSETGGEGEACCPLQDSLLGFRNRLVGRQWDTHRRVVDCYLDHGRAILPRNLYRGIDQAFNFGSGHVQRPKGRPFFKWSSSLHTLGKV